MGNGLLEVTVRQRGTKSYDSAGIVFRVDAARRMALVFTVSSGGEWELARYHGYVNGLLFYQSTLRSDDGFIGGISAIHRGQDAPNRLAVLMQDSTFTFFINGQFVGRYQANGVPGSGIVGVYVDTPDSPTTFSDLLIAPA